MIKSRVKEVAEEQGVNQADLTRKTDLGSNTIWRVWNNRGTPGDMKVETLVRIAKALGVTIEDLIDYDESTSPVLAAA
jgi:transcriptional regulator with XRE-family HTH domain